jgi:class 3 adenylate cyclase/tetratricopeptide (TPR) repeat protein
MTEKISVWLEDLGLGQYSTAFKENAIDWDLLSELDQQTLKDIGIGIAGHRLRILKATAAISTEASTIAQDIDVGSPKEANPSSELKEDVAAWSRTPGERKPVTMLFADIVSSTSLTEKLDAEEAHELLYQATHSMCEAVEGNGGTVCRFMGDGIMAMFGAPVARERHALEACLAAIDMQAAVTAYAKKLQSTQCQGLQIRVGLNSGEVVVLEVGDDPEKPEYDASGPTVPMAARMEQSAEAGTILITETTRTLAGKLVEVENREPISVKGVSEPVTAFRLMNVLSATAASDHAVRRPFVGRKMELAQFASLLEICLDSSYGKTIYIRGEAGIGKTHLLEEITSIARNRGLRHHKVLVLDFGAGKGQEAIPALTRSLLGITPGSNKEQREQALRQAVNDGVVDTEHRVYLNDLLDLPQPLELRTVYDAMDVDARGTGKRAALVDIVHKLADQQPLLMVVEDLHWADEVTLEYLAKLATAVAECAAFLVMTSRIEGDPLGKSWRLQTGDSPIATWDLGPLRMDESISLVSGFIDASDEVAKKCIERAAGNPLFLEQLLLNVQKGTSESVPDSIKSLVLTRIDQLPSEDKRASQAAAVLGQRFELDALQFLLDDNQFSCRNLIEHQLVRPETSMFLFAHALIQEGSYASLLKRQRVELHLRAAEWYRERDFILYAEHLDQAGDARAPRAYLDTARQQLEQYHPRRALQLVARGLELTTAVESYELTMFQANLLYVLGQVAESIVVYAQAREIAINEHDLCRALVGMAQGKEVIDAHDEIADILDEAEPIARKLELNYELAQILHVRGGVLFFQSDIDAGIETCRAALTYARKANSSEIIADALSGLGDAEYCRGHLVSALGYFEECITLAREHGIGRIIAANLTMKSLIFAFQNKIAQAIELHNETHELAVKTHNLRAEMINQVSGGYIWLVSGNLDKAEASIERSIVSARQLGSGLMEGTALGYLARIEYFQGKPEAACRTAMESLEILRKTEAGMTFRAPACLGVLALATSDEKVRRKAWQEAEALLSAGSISHNYFNFYEDAVETCLRLGEWDEADRFGQALENYNCDEPLVRCEYVVARGRALTAYGRGQRDEQSVEEIRRIYEYGKKSGQGLSLAALEAALSGK